MYTKAFLPVLTASCLQRKPHNVNYFSRGCYPNAWRTSRRKIRTLAMAKMPAADATSSEKHSLVDVLLKAVEGTDFSSQHSKSERENVVNIIEQLLTSSGSPPTSTDPRLFGCFSVLYSVTPQSSRQKLPAVGGYLRSPLGRFLFRTTGLYQHLIQPDVVVNLLRFRFLGFINGMVSLYGTASPEGNGTRYLIVSFESPRTRLGPAVFQYGPTSSVSLEFCYVDDRIRIDRGKRGTFIVLLRRPSPDSWPEADAWKDFLVIKPWPTFVLPLMLLSVVALSFRAPLFIRILLISFVIATARVLNRGRLVPKFTVNQDKNEASK